VLPVGVKKMITQSELKDVVDYCPDTGVFTWKVSLSYRGKAGTIAGNVRKDGYWRIMIRNKMYYSHRLAWLYVHGEFPICYIDHINHNKSDNRIENLRNADTFSNAHNIKKFSTNTSGHKGICWHKKAKKWMARFKCRGKVYYLGVYSDIEEAVKVYEENAKKYHKEFFCV